VLPEAKLRLVLRRLPVASSHGPWVRTVGFHLLHGPPPGSPAASRPQPLWPGGAAALGARFTPKGSFGTIYLASDPITALLEVEAIFQGTTSIRTPPLTIFAVEGVLDRVLDLTDIAVEHALGTSLAELSGDWRFSQERYLRGLAPMPPGQQLGRMAYESGRFDAIQYRSAKDVKSGLGWAVFADRLTRRGRSHLRVEDEYGLIGQQLP
jgi:RES domain